MPLGRLWLYEDVTEARSIARSLLEAKEAAEQGSRAKAAFLATMSHEIRTPMNGILGMTDLALAGELASEPREQLGWVKSSAESLLTILNDILDFSKIDAGRMELECRPFSLAKLLDSLVHLHTRQAKPKGVDLSWSAEPGVPQRVMGDSVRLGQVLSNLISNAVKFTAQGSVTVHLALAPAEAGDPPGQVRLQIAVRDTGPGIASDRLEQIFTPFTQADASITRRFGGTGLGLNIASHLARLMGGGLRVESVLGQGSTFRFQTLLLRSEGSEEGEAGVEPQAGRGGGAHVLLVEDTPVNQVLGRTLLEKSGYRVTLAKDGVEAVAAVEQGLFDVILMDMQMPNMDGLEATRRIRAHEDQRERDRVPIIALTANAMESDRLRCMEAGMDGFLAKPFRKDDVIAVLGRFLQGRG